MNTFCSNLLSMRVLAVVVVLGFGSHARLTAQTTATPTAAGSSSAATSISSVTTPVTSPTTPTVSAGRFTELQSASPTVQTAVANAQAAAQIARQNPIMLASPDPGVARAVAVAGAAIAQEGRMARSEVLAERQAALTRLRLAQTEAERTRLIEDLRTQSGRRLEEQRESARLVRDRLRELRDTTMLAPRPGG